MNTFLHPVNNSDPGDSTKADLLYQCISHNKMGGAMLIAKSLESSARADVIFNIAIAYSIARNFSKSLEFFDRAISAIKKKMPSASHAPKPADFLAARKLDASTGGAFRPISREYIAEFPEIALCDFLMAAAAAANAVGMDARRGSYLAELAGPEYAEFKDNLSKGKNDGD
ncbi:MAG: hypothetical protein LBL21_00650 [Rickettsiales bacterium]|nr:hypothetical protein [Rickettsiales bacterium]